MIVKFEDYQTYVKDQYGIEIPDCDKAEIMPIVDIVETYALSIYQGQKQCCMDAKTDTEDKVDEILIESICKGTYYFRNYNTEDVSTIDFWKEQVYKHLRNNGRLAIYEN